MAKKNKPSLDDAVNTFKDVMNRSSLSEYLFINNTLISKNPKDNSIIVVIDHLLWNAIINDNDLKDNIKELDIANDLNKTNTKIASYGNDINSELWMNLDCDKLYSGEIIKISINNFEYQLSINKSLIPLKLRKSEFNNITYRIFNDDMTLAIKKRFDYPIEDHGFSIIRLFQII